MVIWILYPYSDDHLNTGPFSVWTTLDHSNTGLVSHSDPHCSWISSPHCITFLGGDNMKTSLPWQSAQHPNAGQNIQHHIFPVFFDVPKQSLKPALLPNNLSTHPPKPKFDSLSTIFFPSVCPLFFAFSSFFFLPFFSFFLSSFFSIWNYPFHRPHFKTSSWAVPVIGL